MKATVFLCGLWLFGGTHAEAQTTTRFIPEAYTAKIHPKVDPFVEKSLIEALIAMNEPSLWEAPSDQASFRFT